jgi:hypothetical protein
MLNVAAGLSSTDLTIKPAYDLLFTQWDIGKLFDSNNQIDHVPLLRKRVVLSLYGSQTREGIFVIDPLLENKSI